MDDANDYENNGLRRCGKAVEDGRGRKSARNGEIGWENCGGGGSREDPADPPPPLRASTGVARSTTGLQNDAEAPPRQPAPEAYRAHPEKSSEKTAGGTLSLSLAPRGRVEPGQAGSRPPLPCLPASPSSPPACLPRAATLRQHLRVTEGADCPAGGEWRGPGGPAGGLGGPGRGSVHVGHGAPGRSSGTAHPTTLPYTVSIIEHFVKDVNRRAKL